MANRKPTQVSQHIPKEVADRLVERRDNDLASSKDRDTLIHAYSLIPNNVRKSLARKFNKRKAKRGF
jgi:hypothetical protein